ncbi:MAG TPA: hypothetical protein PKD37_00720 [Oligoflexia bacterium]|nr:hypothetical protein [Oligoflexia bacterium]HMP26504.1 hypothetical protein [Oligoflexia bacterium]
MPPSLVTAMLRQGYLNTQFKGDIFCFPIVEQYQSYFDKQPYQMIAGAIRNKIYEASGNILLTAQEQEKSGGVLKRMLRFFSLLPQEDTSLLLQQAITNISSSGKLLHGEHVKPIDWVPLQRDQNLFPLKLSLAGFVASSGKKVQVFSLGDLFVGLLDKESRLQNLSSQMQSALDINWKFNGTDCININGSPRSLKSGIRLYDLNIETNQGSVLIIASPSFEDEMTLSLPGTPPKREFSELASVLRGDSDPQTALEQYAARRIQSSLQKRYYPPFFAFAYLI